MLLSIWRFSTQQVSSIPARWLKATVRCTEIFSHILPGILQNSRPALIIVSSVWVCPTVSNPWGHSLTFSPLPGWTSCLHAVGDVVSEPVEHRRRGHLVVAQESSRASKPPLKSPRRGIISRPQLNRFMMHWYIFVLFRQLAPPHLRPKKKSFCRRSRERRALLKAFFCWWSLKSSFWRSKIRCALVILPLFSSQDSPELATQRQEFDTLTKQIANLAKEIEALTAKVYSFRVFEIVLTCRLALRKRNRVS